MRKAETIAEFVYLCGISIAFFPFLILVCHNSGADVFMILSQSFVSGVISALTSYIIPHKHTRILQPLSAIVITLISFLLSGNTGLFYRILVSAEACLVCILSQRKYRSSVCSVYFFAFVSFADVVLQFVTAYSFQGKGFFVQIISYVVFVLLYGGMSYFKAGADFMRKNPESKVNLKPLFVPLVSFGICCVLSVPVSALIKGAAMKILKALFKNVGGGNTQRPEHEGEPQDIVPPEIVPSSQLWWVKYVIIALFVIMAVFFVFYMRYEIADFFRRIFSLKRRKKHCRGESIFSCNDYTDIVSYEFSDQKDIAYVIASEKVWRKRYRRYCREKWSQDRIKNAMELAVNGLVLCGLEIRESDTVLDIGKMLDGKLADEWEKACGYYMLFKYNDCENIEQNVFDKLLETIWAEMKKVK